MKNIIIFIWKFSQFGCKIFNIFEIACFRNEKKKKKKNLIFPEIRIWHFMQIVQPFLELETICMKCQILLSRKNKKISICPMLNLPIAMLKVLSTQEICRFRSACISLLLPCFAFQRYLLESQTTFTCKQTVNMQSRNVWFDFEFYCPANTVMVILSHSVNLPTLFPGQPLGS